MSLEDAATDVCKRCGHPRCDHYEYILNGHPQVRCKSCDPMADAPAGNYEMVHDSYFAAMYWAADHDFVLRDDQP